MWTRRTIRLLIDQRKHRNNEYHFEYGRNKRDFWRSVARRINRVAGTNFDHRQCSRKWSNLVSAFNVNITSYYIYTVYKKNILINKYNISGYIVIYKRPPWGAKICDRRHVLSRIPNRILVALR
jgi:Myb/SANT-like DNA-binding domain